MAGRIRIINKRSKINCYWLTDENLAYAQATLAVLQEEEPEADWRLQVCGELCNWHNYVDEPTELEQIAEVRGPVETLAAEQMQAGMIEKHGRKFASRAELRRFEANYVRLEDITEYGEQAEQIRLDRCADDEAARDSGLYEKEAENV